MYLGKEPQFTQFPSKFFNGDGTAMTVSLDYSPPNEAALLVFIDGVRQDTDAYNLSGTSLTFTGTVASGTNNVQVVHMGLAMDVGVPGDDTISTAKIQDDAVTAAKIDANAVGNSEMADDAVGVAELSATGTASATTFLRGDNSWVVPTDTVYNDAGLQDDIAILGFKVAANGSLAKYDLVDQTIDDFQDTSGVDASASTDEARNSAGKYYSGSVSGPAIDSYVETLFHGDGSNSGTTFTDSSSNAFTVSSSGSIVTSTTSPKFGTASIHVPNATNDYIYWGAGSANLDYGANPWTISFWIKTTHSSGTGGIIGRNNGSAGNHNFDIKVQISATGMMSVVTNTNTEYGSAGLTTTAVNDGEWHHVEFTRSGANVRGFIDGVLEGTTDVTVNSVINRTSSAIYLGYMNGGHYGGAVCYLDEVEISLGIARHTATFTPPVAPWGETVNNDMTLISTATTAQSQPTKSDLVMTYSNGAGTVTLDTDLKAYSSRDNGGTYTQMPLTSEGTTGGHNIVTAHDVDISSQPAGTAMRYKIETLNQSVSRETRIQAVSLGWS